MSATPTDLQTDLLETDPDWVCFKRCGFSMKKMLDRYPNGCPPHIIAAALLMTEEEVEEAHRQIVQHLRTTIGVSDHER